MEAIEKLFYHIDPPNRTRTVPMQVLAVGPSRSGTRSLRASLLQLGYEHCYHGFDVIQHAEDDVSLKREQSRKTGKNPPTAEDFDKVIGHCMAITDHPAAAFAPELIAAYPDAKVILNVRKDVRKWHKSVMETLMPVYKSWRFSFRSYFCAELYWMQKSFVRGNWNIFYRGNFEKNSYQALRDHVRMVKSIVSPERLLGWDICDGWEPLCEFLGKPVPGKSLPHLNSERQYLQRFDDRVAHADKNIMKCLAIMGLFWALWAIFF
ncbi:hypothetical protein N7488_000806 [Penicillium malachiteum]|nr:hypothetical protein N7488_000806 [Penicillium malachiteum]